MDITLHNLHYLVMAGSHSYGLATNESDYDLRGWCIPTHDYFTTFDKKFEQNDQKFEYKDYPFKGFLDAYIAKNKLRTPQPAETIDHCIFDVRKFFKLASDCNPNIIELLFVDDQDILIMTPFGKMVRDNRDLFLSARAKFTFTGYAYSQLKRINLHRRYLLHPIEAKPSRAEYGLPATSVIPADQREAAETMITDQVRGWLLQDAEIDRTVLSGIHDKLSDFLANILAAKDLVLELTDEEQLIDLARLSAMNQMGMTKNYISVLQAEKKYRTRLKEYSLYNDWKKNRNPARAVLEEKFGMDCKHASQLIRLLLGGKEILTKGTLTVRRPQEELDMIKSVRTGGWTYEQLIEYLEKFDAELRTIYDEKKYVVPHHPDIVKLSSLCNDIVLSGAFTEVMEARRLQKLWENMHGLFSHLKDKKNV